METAALLGIGVAFAAIGVLSKRLNDAETAATQLVRERDELEHRILELEAQRDSLEVGHTILEDARDDAILALRDVIAILDA